MPPHAAAYLKRAAELKMRPLIIFDYNNPHYDDDGFPNSPEAIAAFAAYAVDLARQTRGTVEHVRGLERVDRGLRHAGTAGRSRPGGLRPPAEADLRGRQAGVSRSDRRGDRRRVRTGLCGEHRPRPGHGGRRLDGRLVDPSLSLSPLAGAIGPGRRSDADRRARRTRPGLAGRPG